MRVPLLLALVVGCTPARTPSPRPLGGDARSTSEGDTPRAVVGPCVEAKLSPAKNRDDGIDAYLDGRVSVAADMLDEAVRSDPRDRAADAFRRGAEKKLEARRERAREELRMISPVVLETPPLARTSKKTIAPLPQSKVKLEKESEKKNLITDSADWEKRNQLASPYVPPDRVAPVAPSLRDRPRAVLKHPDHLVALYNGLILASGDGRRSVAFDTTRVEAAGLSIGFAQIVGGTLIVQAGYNGYAKERAGKNAYILAFDGGSGDIVWSSDPLVATSHEALVSGGSIVTGYGFTAEPDFLYILDLATGATEQKISLKSAPEAIRAKGDRVFVRTYDVDYVFKSNGPLAAPPPANLPRYADATTTVDAETRCFARNAAAALKERDRAALKVAIDGLAARSKDHQLLEFLRSEEAFLADERRLDLTSAPLIALAAPPWEAMPAAQAPRTTSDPKLVKVRSAKNEGGVPTRLPVFSPDKPWFIAPVAKGALPPGARADIPRSYGLEDLRAILPSSSKVLLVYGGRYLAIVRGDHAERVFDLELYRHPPKANPQWKEFAIQDVTFAQELEGVLYVCNGGGSYAKEVYGKKGFLSAIEVASGKLLWRSPPLTCNAPFVVSGAHIISGYGFTEEPDFVFVVRRADGTIVQRVPVDTGPETITLEGASRVHVETYGSIIDFELR